MSDKKIASFTKGYSFVFSDEGHEIEAWFSSLTGLEKFYVDGEVVSRQRTFSKNSSNEFKIGANGYSANLEIVSLLRGPFVCTLCKNGEAYKRQRLSFSGLETGGLPFYKGLAFSILIGALYGFAQTYWQLPEESFYFFIGALLIALLFCAHFFNKGRGPIIEDEEIA